MLLRSSVTNPRLRADATRDEPEALTLLRSRLESTGELVAPDERKEAS
jgi:hypothetical protein